MTTFKQFKATRKWSNNLQLVAPDHFENFTYIPVGNTYCDDLFIEQTANHEWTLVLENNAWTLPDLDLLERKLFAWAITAGY